VPRDGDGGSGTVVAVGVLGAVTALALATVAVSSVLVERAAAAGAADSGALAAADVAAGFATGSPCSAAEEVVVAAGASLTACEVTGTTAVVEAERHGGPMGIAVTASARAGQPPSGASG
jgi:secretion/DNA translocation related TadE-like protein